MREFAKTNESIIEGWESRYARTNTPCVVDFRSLVRECSPDRHTHLLHSYPAKLLPQIPTFFLENKKFTQLRRPTVLADPFCGSGTVLLEGAIRGHEVVGADTNPLARLIARVKTNPISTRSIRDHLMTINHQVARMGDCDLPPVVNLSEWYAASVAKELGKLRLAIARIESKPVREFMLVCFSVCVRKMSRADPRLSVPVKINLARKEKYGPHFDQLKRHLDHMRPENVVGTFNTIVERNSMRMDSLRQMLRHKPKISIFDDARTLHSDSGTKSIDLIITSPPYIGAQKYIRSSSLSLGWLDLAYEHELRPLEKLTIGREHLALPEIKDECVTGIRHADKLLRLIRKRNLLRAHMACVYLTEMRSALRSMHRALRPRGKLIIVTGPNTISGYHFDTPSFIEEIACSVGFSSQFKLIDHIRSRGLMTKRNKTAGLIASELVLSFTRS